MGLPLGACVRSVSPGGGHGPPREEVVSCEGGPFDCAFLSAQLASSQEAELQQALMPDEPYVATLRELERREVIGVMRVLEPFIQRYGAEDILVVSASDGVGGYVFLAAPWPEVLELDPHLRRRWYWLAMHLSVAKRLREMEGAGKPTSLTGLSFEPHTPGEPQLGRPIRAAGEQLWGRLVDGSWSVVEAFTGAGRRVFVAQPVQSTEGGNALTWREEQVVALAAMGHSNKVIAYQLELTESTVGSHLKRALEKLGLRSRIELVQIVSHLVGELEVSEVTRSVDDRQVNFQRIEEALTVCAQELARLDGADLADSAGRARVEELRATLQALERLLPIAAG